jgi:hypothetical protein
MFGMDESKKMVVVNQNTDDINTEWLQEKDAIYLNDFYQIEPAIANVQTGIGYQVTNTRGDTYTLYFTQSPLIFITATDSIVDEPRVPAKFTMIESNGNKIIEDIGIETRGGWTQFFYSKKSYRFSFKESASSDNNKDVCLLDMRSDNKWDLQAMANEPLRMNEKTSFDIWRKINTLYYQSSEPEATNGCRMKYAELFLNGDYKGIYCVSEPLDRKQLKLKKYDEKKGIRGELYKSHGWGATVFSDCPPYSNNSFSWVNSDNYGYDCEYPEDVYPDWKNMYNFVHLVIYDSDIQFYNQYQMYFNLENAVDYFIFLNVALARDNTGNNLFVARYNANEPYFYVPWDFDGTFGNKWDGTQYSKTDELLSNGFYNRLLKDHPENEFRQKLQVRWNQLRNDWLTVSNLMDMFTENYNYLVENGVYEREEITWKDKDNYRFNSEYIAYMQEWITERLKFLDNEFNYITAIPKVGKSDIQYPCDVYIYNTIGQLVKTVYLTDSDDKALYSNLKKGIYVVWFHNQNAKGVKTVEFYVP